jgi:hypothetical protein
MSTLSQFGGGGIKSTQRGNSSNGTVTISAVDTTKSMLRNLGNGNGTSSVVLTNSTTITVSGASGSTSWELTEFY